MNSESKTTDNFNFICDDCGPRKGNPAVVTQSHATYCVDCLKQREKDEVDERRT